MWMCGLFIPWRTCSPPLKIGQSGKLYQPHHLSSCFCQWPRPRDQCNCSSFATCQMMNEWICFFICFEVLLWIQQTLMHKCCNKNASRDLSNLWKCIHGSFITVLTPLKLFLQNYKCLLKKCQATWSGKHSDLPLSKIIDKNGVPHSWKFWKTSDGSEVISFDMSLENSDHLRPFICIQIYEKNSIFFTLYFKDISDIFFLRCEHG